MYIYRHCFCTPDWWRDLNENPEPGVSSAEAAATSAKVGPRGQPACSRKHKCLGRPAKLPDATPTGCSDTTSVRTTFAVREGIARLGA